MNKNDVQTSYDCTSLPSSMDEEAVARWMLAIECCGLDSITEASIVEELRLSPYPAIARAVLALCETVAVRAIIAYDPMANSDPRLDGAIIRVMGKEADRG